MTAQIDERIEKAFDLVRDPSRWPAATTDQLLEILHSFSEWLGSNYSEERFEEFRPFYWHIAERTTADQRLGVLLSLAEEVEFSDLGPVSLLPFLCADEDTKVISTAAMNLAVLIPPMDGDPLSGPKYILEGLDTCDTENSLVGNLQGVLLLGDCRVLPLLDRCWERLG
ncbi:MAG: hypothetical protein IH628_01920, partial [Proteobacteria bacterium]|nr:hypothetical protein [Pseudomonadota bacterium]